MSVPQRLLVVGGNGFLGSAVCRAAISRGWDVHSLSTSGLAPKMPGGEIPAWTEKVTYHTGSAFDPSTFSHLIPPSTAVVHAMGILLESDYKSLTRETSLLGLAGKLVGGAGVLGGNPLKKANGGGAAAVGGAGGGGAGEGGYERINRDSALSVVKALLESKASPTTSTSTSPASPSPTPFVYVSAEDIFRPFVPARYISSKREAERGIQQLVSEGSIATPPSRLVQPLIVRPGIMTHPTLRPFLSLLPPFLALSSALPPVIPSLLRALPLALPLSLLRKTLTSSTTSSSSLEGSPASESMARFLETRTLDVDDVGEAVCVGIERGLGGVVGVEGLRRLAHGGSA